MSTSTGAIIGSIFHARIAGDPKNLSGHITLFPPYISRTSGKKVPMKAEFNAYVNSLRGTNAKTGEPGRVDRVKVSLVGQRALLLARYGSVGKMFSGSYTLNTYTGVLYQPNGQPYVLPDGTKIQAQKTTLVMDDFLLGDDAPNAIALEIQSGLRPQNWNVPGHPDVQAWDNMKAQRKTMVWDGRSEFFGFARVYPVDGQILMDEMHKAPAQTGYVQHAAAPAPTPNGMGGFVQQNMQQAANNGFTPYAPAQAAVQHVQPAPNGFNAGGSTMAGGFNTGGRRF